MGCHTVYAVCTAHPRLVRVCASYVQFPLSPTHPQRQAALRLRFAYRPVCTACTITQKADGVHVSTGDYTGAHHPYLHRGVRLHQIEQDGVTHPPTRGQLSRVSGRVELGSELASELWFRARALLGL